MLYVWKIPEDYLNKDIGTYDRDCSPKSYLLSLGKTLTQNEFSMVPTVLFDVSKKRISKFDCLPNNTLTPLVNQRVKTILEKLAPSNIQCIPAKLICLDGMLDGYYFLNITCMITGIDHEKSIYTKMKTVDAISSFKYLTYKDGCMKEHNIARDKEYHTNILVSEKLKSEFEKEHISGVFFVKPEDYFRPVTASDLLNE